MRRAVCNLKDDAVYLNGAFLLAHGSCNPSIKTLALWRL